MLKSKMKSLEALRKKLSPQMRRNRDKRIKELVELFYLAHKLQNVAEACARRGVSRDYYYRWWGRLKRARLDIQALRPCSRKPKRSPRRISFLVEAKIKRMRKRTGLGPQQMSWHLERQGVAVSASTVGHVLARRRSRKLPKKPRLKAHRKRYELPIPGQRLQMDLKYSPRLLDGTKTYTYVAVDECTRWRFARTFSVYGGYQTKLFLDELKQKAPFPIQCIQTDNGSEFTNRLQPYEKRCRYDEHWMEEWCRENKVYHRLIPPGEKELNGKVERSHRIDEEYFYHSVPRDSLESFNRALDRWMHRYNTKRPHGGLGGLTPAEKLIERRLRLPLEEVEPRWVKMKTFFLQEMRYKLAPWLKDLDQLEKELLLYNENIRG